MDQDADEPLVTEEVQEATSLNTEATELLLAARKARFKVIAVATGVDDLESLRRAGAQEVLRDLADTAAFLAAVDRLRPVVLRSCSAASAPTTPKVPPRMSLTDGATRCGAPVGGRQGQDEGQRQGEGQG